MLEIFHSRKSAGSVLFATRNISIAAMILSFILPGCSAGKSPLESDSNGNTTIPAAKGNLEPGTQHMLWGFWRFAIDKPSRKIDIVTVRAPQFHMDLVPFLEPPAFGLLNIDNAEFGAATLEFDVLITHPLAGKTEFSAFDVCGIVITKGQQTGYGEDITVADWGDSYLLNADGYSRWWNPREFPHAPVLGYTDGLIGGPDAVEQYNCNINGYKYFADKLSSDDDISMLPGDSRGYFTAGATNKRHYILVTGWEMYTVNYAVDACWEFPNGSGPWQVPGSFPQKANRSEPYRIETYPISNDLFCDDYAANSGGSATLSIKVYDWFNAGMNKVTCRSNCGIPPASASSPTSTGPGWATYEIVLDGSGLTCNGVIVMIVMCESEDIGYEGFLPGIAACSYFTAVVTVGDPTPGAGWVATIGTPGDDDGYAVATQQLGYTYITGRTDPSTKQNYDAYLARFKPDGGTDWFVSWGAYNDAGTDYDEGYDVAVDQTGYIYVTGIFMNTVDFNPGEGVDNHVPVGERDIFLCKYHPNGTFLWAMTWGGISTDRAYSIAIDNSGYIFLTGWCEMGPIDFNPSPSESAYGDAGPFVIKFDSTGDFKWVRVLSTRDAFDVATDPYGNIFVTGDYSDDPDFDPSSGSDHHPSNGSSDIYVSKFTNYGDYLGTGTIGGEHPDGGVSIIVDEAGSMYLSGYCSQEVDFNPGPGTHIVTCEENATFVCKFGKYGKLKWAGAWGQNYSFDPQSYPQHNLAVDAHGYVYCSGEFEAITDFDPGPATCKRRAISNEDTYISKFAPGGTFQWVHTWGPAPTYGMSLDQYGNIYLVGTYYKNSDLDPSPGYYKKGAYEADVYLMKLLPDGYW